MTTITSPGFERALAGLRARAAPVPVAEVARTLLALRREPASALARRVVAEILGVPEPELADPLASGLLRPAVEARVEARALGRARFAVVDLETTGVSRERSRILEIGAVLVVRGRPAGRFDTLVRPETPVPAKIVALTGIDDAAVADAPPRDAAVAGFRRWLAQSRAAAFVAHNAAFDAGFLTRDLRDLGLAPLGVPVLCTRKLARRLLPALGRYGLDPLCAHFGIGNPARHRAGGDAFATARALGELLVCARARGLATVGDLLDLQAAPPPRRRRRKR